MKLFLIFLFFDFYENDNNLTIYNKINNQIILLENDYFIHFCQFQNLSLLTGNGGAIYYYTFIKTQLLIEFCIFYKCNTILNGKGGALYLDCINGSIVLNKLCGYECFTSNTSSFQFSFSSSSLKNFGFYLSISYCSPNSLGFHCCSRFLNGISISKYHNYSYNTILEDTPTLSFNTYSLDLSFLTISNNFNKLDSVIIQFYYSKNNIYNFYNSNILNNTQKIRLGIIHCHDVRINLLNIIFFNNSGNLFSSFSNTIIFLNDISVDIYSATFQSPFPNSTIIYNSFLNNSFLKLYHYKTFLCEVENIIKFSLNNQFERKKKIQLFLSFLFIFNYFSS